MKLKEEETAVNDGAGGKDSTSLVDQGISTNKQKEKVNEEEGKNDQNIKNKA